MDLIAASKAYSLAHEEGKNRLYQHIENAAKSGDMYYDTDCASLTQDVVDELKAAGYEISLASSCYTRISWRHFNSAPNQ